MVNVCIERSLIYDVHVHAGVCGGHEGLKSNSDVVESRFVVTHIIKYTELVTGNEGYSSWISLIVAITSTTA